ncbi:MAG: DUF262 domain-containing protein [Desulfoplanes sp.]|nr:DUF262 domain-containing protein [Desulfoplanes sp.]MDD4648728.1 DUF262 domain-containing protein [Desulfoplanes sp.]
MPAISNTFGTEEPFLGDLLRQIDEEIIQLPDFQRGWVWDDNHIRALIASVSQGYPIGALMTMETGGDGVRFAPRVFEGVSGTGKLPDYLMLDGQQRMTSLFLSLKNQEAVTTCDTRKKDLKRFYYLDMVKCLDESVDRLDAVVSVPETRVVTYDFGRVVDLDLSDPSKEFEARMFPINIIFDPELSDLWSINFEEYHGYEKEHIKFRHKFQSNVLAPFQRYKIPVIKLLKETPKEAVCQVFEDVNTGGVSLTVFELLTATYAADDFRLRQDWEERQKILRDIDPVLHGMNEKDFLTSITLLCSYKRNLEKGSAVSCKRRDVLNLELASYRSGSQELMTGLRKAARFLHSQKIYDTRNLPYQTQMIPLSVICSLLGPRFDDHTVKKRIAQWFWCGVLGELYGGANETRFVLDVQNFFQWLEDDESPVTVRDATFDPVRLLSLQTRNSAAYKGIMGLMMGEGSQDFISGDGIGRINYFDEAVDIHHIFPRKYCEQQGLKRKYWNSIINKAPLMARTNRILGGKAPSTYLKRIVDNHNVDELALTKHLVSHLITPDLLRADDFDNFIADRATRLLDIIETAMGKRIAGRESEETVNAFGRALVEEKV